MIRLIAVSLALLAVTVASPARPRFLALLPSLPRQGLCYDVPTPCSPEGKYQDRCGQTARPTSV